ncbi:heavy-metal-associated domain-containing protein [Mycobacterium nebraskense]|uniref:heavy-metal-associated domain-containing protein n=1 Tax=Mycobacterium nebraskense TaxID=244292 RepID=UPI0006180A82|nr:heavy metal-associated domain-containing protein [Mycobacterium nebraskense]KKC05801.1 cation-transporting ATPase [Mycobacterium nebraskense]KLO39650.1 cation-transporting ATPase [Mycobacterium nebraskense]
MSTVTVTVDGMSCDHCASSVREELGHIPGVKEVDVDLASGQVCIVSDYPVDTAAIEHAVDEAGYQLGG